MLLIIRDKFIALRARIRGIFYSIFLKSVGRGFQVNSYSVLYGLNNTKIGNNVIIGSDNFINGKGGLVIEDNVLFGPDVKIITESHSYSDITKPIRAQKKTYKPIVIRNGAWLCANCVILPGVTIGKNSVVAAGAIVNKDVPDYAIVGGVPAKVIKYIKNTKKH